MLHLGVVEGVLQRIDRPTRHPRLVQEVDPIGALVGWLLPTCSGRSLAIVQRAAWKSSKKIIASSRDACTHWPTPEVSRSNKAVKMPLAQSNPAPTSESAAPERIGPRPGSPV